VTTTSDRDLERSGSAGAPVPRPGSPYWTFYEEVAAAQLAAWLPPQPQRVLDLSGGRLRSAEQLVEAGHCVVHVRSSLDAPAPAARHNLLPVVGDARGLSWVQEGSVDAVLAESRALSMCLATEVTVEDLRRVLRPGGRLLLVVESLVLGLARLAERGRWAELADLPSADVVLVPQEDGTITRCFWPEELQVLLGDAGLDVEWVRPRSVLSPATVERALAEGGHEALRALVRAECALAEEREGESTGLHLVASARRPALEGSTAS
jgi:SAM-dependent methyltransferase